MSALQSNFETPQTSPGFLLWQVSNKWQAAQRKALAAYDLTHVQFVLLAALAWLRDDTITQKELAAYAGTDIMMTSQVLRVLEKRGLVERTISASDKRAIHVSLTDTGQSLVNQAIVEVERVDSEFFGQLGKDATVFTASLRRLQ